MLAAIGIKADQELLPIANNFLLEATFERLLK